MRGLGIGGDDYLGKPFSLLEFSARVRAVLRREAKTRESRLTHGPLEMDFALRRVSWLGRTVELSEREFTLLELFALHPERSFSPDELLTRFFPQADSGLRIVRVYVHHLRQKLAHQVIATRPNGYGLGV